MRELLLAASRMGVGVHIAHLDDPDVVGCYDHEARAIYLSFDLTPVETRSVLAHELGHAYFGDECSDGPQERRAERWAANALIRPEAYAAAESLCSDVWAIADELNVTEDIVETYQRECLQRLGRRTYGRSWRTGLGGALARQLSN